MMLNNYDELNYRNIKMIVIRTKFKIQMTCIITHRYTHIHTQTYTYTHTHVHTPTHAHLQTQNIAQFLQHIMF